MPPTRDQRSSPGPRRTRPLLIFAGGALVLVCVLAVVTVARRSSGRADGGETASDVLSAAVPTGSGGGPGVARQVGLAPASPPQPVESPAPVDASVDEIPIWARVPPLVAMPYPEGGAYNPPLPPVQLPPGMAATELPDGGTSDTF